MSHAWRPVFVVIGALIFILVVRVIIKPSDFVIHNGDYKYQFYRTASLEFWENFPVKHMGRDFCNQCHSEMLSKVSESGHQNVQCENCHAVFKPEMKSHPIDLKTDFKYLLDIGIDKSRDLCKRCHTRLSYRPATYVTTRGEIPFKMIDPKQHNPGLDCVMCHDVHKTGFK